METLHFAPLWDDPRAEKPRFSGVAYAGGLIPSFGIHGDAAIDLAGFSEAKVMILGGHGDRIPDIVGAGRAWRSEDQQLLIEGELTQATEQGRIIAQLLAEGVELPLSVGIQAEAEVGRKGRSVVVNNRELHAKTVFRSPRLQEVSFVPVGADPHAHAARCAALEAEMAIEHEVEAQVADLQAKLAAAEDRAVAAEAQAVAAQAQAVAAEARASASETCIQALQRQARQQAVDHLHAQLGQPCTETAQAMFQSLSDEQFRLVREAMLALKPADPPPAPPVPSLTDALQTKAAAQQAATAATASLANIFELACARRTM